MTSLVLVECSKSLTYRGPCQLPSSPSHPRVWHRTPMQHFLYRKSSFQVELNCSIWGQEGVFRLFLTTDLNHAAVIERSAPIKVRRNRDYALDSYFEAIFPCPSGDIKPINVKRPRCAGADDKVRVYGRGIA